MPRVRGRHETRIPPETEAEAAEEVLRISELYSRSSVRVEGLDDALVDRVPAEHRDESHQKKSGNQKDLSDREDEPEDERRGLDQ